MWQNRGDSSGIETVCERCLGSAEKLRYERQFPRLMRSLTTARLAEQNAAALFSLDPGLLYDRQYSARAGL